MLQTHRNLTWKPQAATVREAARLRAIDILAAKLGRTANEAAWAAWCDDVPMTWLPLDWFGPAVRGRHDAYQDAARQVGRAVL